MVLNLYQQLPYSRFSVGSRMYQVVDGTLSRRSLKPTRLGHFDLVADLCLSVSIAICLILWDIIPAYPALIVMSIASLSSIFFHFSAPRKLAMGMVYGIFTFSLCQREPSWVWVILGGGVLLIFLNPKGSKRQVSNFLNEVGSILKKEQQMIFFSSFEQKI